MHNKASQLCFFQISDWPQHYLECTLITEDRTIVETLAPKVTLRLALRVLSRRRKDNGISAEDDLEGWPTTIERRSLDEFLQDQSDIGFGLPVEQQTATEGDLWQFLQEHLPWEKRVVRFLDQGFCEVLFRKVFNYNRIVSNLVETFGWAIYLQQTRFQQACGMEVPDFEIYPDSNIISSVVRSLKHDPKQFETLLTESTQPLTCIELEYLWARQFLRKCPCAFCNDKLRIQLAIYGIWKECDKCHKPLVVIPKDLGEEEAAQVDKSDTSDTEAKCLICKKTVRIAPEKMTDILEYHRVRTKTEQIYKWQNSIPSQAVLEAYTLLLQQLELRSLLHSNNLTVCQAVDGLYAIYSHVCGSGIRKMSAERYERIIDDFATRFKRLGWRSLMLSDIYRSVAITYMMEGKRGKFLTIMNKSRQLLAELIPEEHIAFDTLKQTFRLQ